MIWSSPDDGPRIRFGPEGLLPFEKGITREWLVTNGIGGFAGSTIVGANTRRYHGLLVSATRPPVGRIVSVAKLEETVRAPISSRRPRDGGGAGDPDDEPLEFELSSNQYPETVHPKGYLHIESFTLGRRPRWRYRLRDLWLEKSLFMVNGANTTVMVYAHLAGPDAELTLRPLLVQRDFHALSRENRALNPNAEVLPGLVRMRPYLGLPAIRMACSRGVFLPWPVWYKALEYPVSLERGLDFREDAFSPGTFALRLSAGESCVVVLSTEEPFPGGGAPDPALQQAASQLSAAAAKHGAEAPEANLAGERFARALESWSERAWLDEAARQRRVESAPARGRGAAGRMLEERERDLGLPARPAEIAGGAAAVAAENRIGGERMASAEMVLGADEETLPEDALRFLARAADSFWVRRDPASRSILNGYPWLSDSGRGAMIALPGLLLATGRLGSGRETLAGLCQRLDRGLIPNVFPEVGDEPGRDSADATLWMFRAADYYVRLSGDDDFLRGTLYPAFREAISQHQRGTHHEIGIDEDGLLVAGEKQAALTWMDARAEDRVVTPRRGKAVEVNALWHFALVLQSTFAARLGYGSDAAYYAALAQRVRQAFLDTFWAPALGRFYDVVGERGPDPSLRPNQVIALSFPSGLVPPAMAVSALAVVERQLLTPLGLRTLPCDDPRYQGAYIGDRLTRDQAYHQGTAWPWLLGPYVSAYLQAHGRSARTRAHARRVLEPVVPHLGDGALGTIAEIFDGDAPHLPRGCVSHAWAVAEIARVWIEEDL